MSVKNALATHEIPYRNVPGVGRRLGFKMPTPDQHMQSFLHVISYVYKHANPTELGLRQSIIYVWSGLSEEVKFLAAIEILMELMKEHPEVGGDLIMGLGGGGKYSGGKLRTDLRTL